MSVAVRVMAHSFAVRHGKLLNLSVSGAFLKTDADLRLLTRINVAIELPVRARYEAPVVAAYVARKSESGFGIEWCEFAPRAVSEILRTAASRRHAHSHAHETPAILHHALLSEPLLRHGT